MQCTARALFLCIVVSLCGSHVVAAEILTNEAVVTMVKAGLGDDVIVGKVRLTQGQYDLSTNGLLRLKADGVSETVIKAMIEASAGGEAPGLKPVQAGDGSRGGSASRRGGHRLVQTGEDRGGRGGV